MTKRSKKKPAKDPIDAVNLDIGSAGVAAGVALPGASDAEFEHVELEDAKTAYRKIRERHQACTLALEDAILAPIANALSDLVHEGDDPSIEKATRARLILWTALRRYRGRVSHKTWTAFIVAWNRLQAGRAPYTIRNEKKDVPRLTYDQPPAGEEGLRRPSLDSGVSMPAARLRRLLGYRL